MSEDLLLIERPQPGCVCLTLNRPQALNALSMALRRALAAALDSLARDESVRVLILTGAGRAFCAGLDLRELGQQDLGSGEPESDPVAALARFPHPVIGAVNGVAVTGGFELALACDLLIASTQARFADTHARIGVMPGWGLSQKLSRIVGLARAKEISFSGNYVGAEQAERWGLVNRVVAPERLMPEALALAADIASARPEMLGPYKRLMDEGYGRPLQDALRLETETSRRWAATLDRAALTRRGEEVQARGRQQAG